MTHRETRPTRHNRRQWTAYERARNGVGFDHDAQSCRQGHGIWPDYVSDIEDLTILSGLEDVE